MKFVYRVSAGAAACALVCALAGCGSTSEGSGSTASPSEAASTSATVGPDPRLTFPARDPGDVEPLRDQLIERVEAVGTEVVACVGGDVEGSGSGYTVSDNAQVAEVEVRGSEGARCTFVTVRGAGTMDVAIAEVANVGMGSTTMTVVDEVGAITHVTQVTDDGLTLSWSFTSTPGDIWAVGTTSGFDTADALLELIAP